MSQRYIIVAALSLETPRLDQYAPVVHTGVGKLNAAIHLYDAILQYQPELVINYGTAGAINGKTGLHQINTFIQRDMDVRGLGMPRGVTPFENGEKLPDTKGIVLGSGDSFVTDAKSHLDGLEVSLDLIDMEAYALNKVCKHHAIDFNCYKYVTDNTDEEASNDWAENVAKGARLFEEILTKKYGKSVLSKK